jgi:O-antigen/teichoic acid export membrane protein
MLLYLALYAVAIPMAPLLVGFGVVPWSLALWLVAIVVLDHLGTEIQRLLVVLSRPFASNVLVFLRSGLWVFAAVGLMTFGDSWRKVETVWACWCAGAAVAALFGLWSIRDLPWRRARGPVDRAWLRRGVRSALILFGSLVCLRAVSAVDRYLLQAFESLEAVGTYTFFAGIANSLMVLAESGVLLTQYPRLVQSYQARDLAEYRRVTHVMIAGSAILVTGLTMAIVLCIGPILRWIDKPALLASAPVLWALLGATALQVIGQLVRNALFVRHRDWSILWACLVALVVAALANAVLIPILGILGAALASALAMLAMIASSWLSLRRVPDYRGGSQPDRTARRGR